MFHTTFIKRKTFLENIKETLNLLVNLLASESEDKKIISTETNSILNSYTFHHLTELKANNPSESSFYDLILRQAYLAEKKSAGAGIFLILFSIKVLQELMKTQEDVIVRENEAVEDYQGRVGLCIRSMIKENHHHFKEGDIKPSLKDLLEGNEDLLDLLLETYSLSGLEGVMSFQDGIQPYYSVEYKEGYHFELKTIPVLMSSISDWKKRDVKVFLVDGIIEKVSELETLLNKVIESKRPLLIISQGYGEEVIGTVFANNQRKNFDVMLTKISPDLEGLNVLSDLATVVGGDVLSVLKGERVCFKRYEDIPEVEELCLNQLTGLTIHNPKTKVATTLYLKNLLDKREKIEVEDLGFLLDKRIKSLLNNSVIVTFPNLNEIELKEKREKIDNALRTIKVLLSHGYFDFNEDVNCLDTKDLIGKSLKETIKALPKQMKRYYPVLSVSVGMFFSIDLICKLFTTGGLVMIDE